MKDYSKRRIALAGAQGVGKTTLMNAWNTLTGTPIVRANTTDFMPEGIRSHIDMIRAGAINPEVGINFQKQLILTRSKLFSDHSGGFISDRSVFDSLVYYAVHNAPFVNPNEDLDSILRDASRYSLNSTDLVMLLSPRLNKVDNNKIRTTNLTYYSALNAALRLFIVDAFKSINGSHFDRYEVLLDSHTSMEIWSPNLANSSSIAFLSEGNNPTGISSVELRIEALKKACDLIE